MNIMAWIEAPCEQQQFTAEEDLGEQANVQHKVNCNFKWKSRANKRFSHLRKNKTRREQSQAVLSLRYDSADLRR